MAQDLLAALSVNRYRDLQIILERKISELFEARHEYPIWPEHDFTLDEYEKSIHEPVRHTYYQSTLLLIHILRALQDII